MNELITKKKSYFTPWPSEVDIGFYRGVILTVVLYCVFYLLYVIVDSTLLMIFSFYHKRGITDYDFGMQLNIGTQGIVLYSLRLGIIYVIVQEIAGIRIRTLLCHTSPSFAQSSKWAFIGICLSLPYLITMWRGNYEDPFLYVLMGTVVSCVSAALMAPIQEEIVHRGVLFPALRKKGRTMAYFFSALWFVFGHVPSYSELFLSGNIGLELHHFIILVLVAIVAAHIYESTGNLTLCIIFHGAYNLAPRVSGFLSYLIR